MIYNFFYKLSRLMAYLGGTMLASLIVLICLSVIGRSLNGILHTDFIQYVAPALSHWLLDIGIGPINGDFELLEAGIAFSIFAFFPLCQITGGHAAVDVFTQNLPIKTTRILRLITDIVFAAVWWIIAVQLYAGMQSKMRSAETTFLIEFPVWWAYAPSTVAAFIVAIVALFVALSRFYETWTGNHILPTDLEADH